MRTLILTSAVGLMVIGWAAALESESRFTSVQPGQSLCIRAYRLPGTPDIILERQATQRITKHQAFHVVDKCSEADLTLLLLAQYHNRFKTSLIAINDSPEEYRGMVKAYLLPASDFRRSYHASIPRGAFTSYTFDQEEIALASFWQQQTGSKKVIKSNHHSKLAKLLHEWAESQGVPSGSATVVTHALVDDPFEFEAGQWIYVAANRISGESDPRVQANVQQEFVDYPFFSVTCDPVIPQVVFLVLTEYHFKEEHQTLASKSSKSRPKPPKEFLYFATGYAISVHDFLRYSGPALNLDALREAALWHAQVGSDRSLKIPENRSRLLAKRFHTHVRYRESLQASK